MKQINTRQRLIILFLLMVGLSIIIGAILIYSLHSTSLQQQRELLKVTVQSQARMIEAVARFNMIHSESHHSQQGVKLTLDQIVDAHNHFDHFGNTSEFTLAKKEDNQIIFLLPHSNRGKPMDYDGNKPADISIPFDSRLAEPMRLALQGKSGTIIGLDYVGAVVLAAYEPLVILDYGIVAKIDLAEIQQPFIKAGVMVGGAAIICIIFSTILFFRISEAVIIDLQDKNEKLKHANVRIKKHILELDNAKTYTENIICSMLDALIVLNENATIRMINKATIDLLGYEEHELIGKNFTTILTEKLELSQEVGVHELIQKISVHGMEVTYLTKHRQKLNMLLSGSVMRDDDGNIEGIVCVAHDVTERERAKADCNLLTGILEATSDFVGFCALDGKIVYINRAGRRLLGWSETADLSNRSIAEAHPEWAGRMVLEQGLPACRNGVPWEGEVAILGPDGREIPVSQVIMSHRSKDGVLENYSTIMRDITERKRTEEDLRISEELFRQIAQHIDAVLWIQSPKTNKILYASPAFETIWGSCQNLYDNPQVWMESIIPGDQERIVAAYREMNDTGVFSEIYRVRRCDGEVRWVNSRAFPITDSHGNLNRIVGVITDVTDMQTAKEALKKNEDMFRGLLDAISDPVILFTQKFTVLWANASAADFFLESVSDSLSFTPPPARGYLCDEYRLG